MKKLITILVATAFAAIAQAETTVKLSGVHLCCKSCVKGVATAVAKVDGAKAECDGDAGTVTLTAADAATAQKAVDSIVAAGYFGKSDSAEVTAKDNSGAAEAKVALLTVSSAHLCCKKCVKAVNAALATVKGVTSNTAEEKTTSFEVKGDFSPREVMAALQAAGLTGTTK